MTIKNLTSIDTVYSIVSLGLNLQVELGLIELKAGDVWHVSRLAVETVNQTIDHYSITDYNAVHSLVWDTATKACATFTAERMIEQNR